MEGTDQTQIQKQEAMDILCIKNVWLLRMNHKLFMKDYDLWFKQIGIQIKMSQQQFDRLYDIYTIWGLNKIKI